MKKFLPIVMILFIMSGSTCFAAEDTVGFLGANLGLEVASGGSDDTSINRSGFMYGATGKIFFDRKFGVGLTYFSARHKDNEEEPGKFESDISGTMVDLMISLGKKNKDSINYLTLSYGEATEEFSGEMEIVGDISGEFDSTIWGIGLGSFMTPSKPGFSIGGEVRYLNATDSENADGLLQFYVMLGYAF